MSTVGVNPTTPFSSDDMVRGKIARPGTRLESADSLGRPRQFIVCVVAASQNLTEGMVCTLGDTTPSAISTATAITSTGQAQNTIQNLGVYIGSVTASASNYAYFQIYGPCSVLASASCLPFVTLTGSAATAGRVDDSIATASGIIEGLLLTATTAGTGLTAAYLSYPRWVPPGQAG